MPNIMIREQDGVLTGYIAKKDLEKEGYGKYKALFAQQLDDLLQSMQSNNHELRKAAHG